MSDTSPIREIAAEQYPRTPGVPPGGPASAVQRKVALPFGKRFQRTIITVHRWIGIAVCVMMFVWFISGLVLAYVHFPKMYPSEKLSVLERIDWNQVQVTPAQALAAAGLQEFPRDLRLEMSGGEAVFRISDWRSRHITVSAATGEPLKGVSGERALEIVREQLSAPHATLRRVNLDSDQWTITGYWNKERPFHVVALNDERGSEYYVSVATGEIVLDTHRKERLWNWFGAIPHWLYFEFLRHYSRESTWTWTIYVLSSAGIFVAVSGLWIGLSRLRLKVRYPNGRWTPFSGWMKWHHVTGVLGGLFLALWIISGLLTMYPGGFLEQREIRDVEYKRFAGSERTDFPSDATVALRSEAAEARRVTYRYIGGRPIAVVEDGASKPRAIDAVSGGSFPLSREQLVEAARALVPGGKVVAAAYLENGDEWWHSGFAPRKTPILRVAFDDPEESWFHIDPETGELLGLLDKLGRVDRWTAVAIHDIDWYWLLQRRPLWDILLFAVTVPGILIVLSTLVISYRRLQRTNLIPAGVALRRGVTSAEGTHGSAASPRTEPTSDTVIVGFASQTGTAELIANKTADSLRRAGLSACVRNVSELEGGELEEARRAIFVVSTTGDGDAPDRAIAFQRRVMRRPLALHGMEYALLALGDQQYRTFCSFGIEVDSWLRSSGARPIFPAIQVDGHDADALTRWSRELSKVTGRVDDFRLNPQPYKPWQLSERRLINPGSAGWETFHLAFEPVERQERWDAGDIAQVVAGQLWNGFTSGAPGLIEREYSIASTADVERIHLLVRRIHGPDGQPGLASEMLTSSLAVGGAIPLRIRSNPGFHGPVDDRPMILIGNGTGIAGLRAHLMRRAALGHRRNWLLFGERNAATDRFYKDDLQHWHDQGVLERLDLVFSRDQRERRYVQDLLREAAPLVRTWVQEGAAVYVCGSLQGMAPAVTARLVEILGDEHFEELTRSGRYCRDVY